MSREVPRKLARPYNAGVKIDGNWHPLGTYESRLSCVLFQACLRPVASFRTSLNDGPESLPMSLSPIMIVPLIHC
jgi:hypothetical protein